jgi:O-antigen ligase
MMEISQTLSTGKVMSVLQKVAWVLFLVCLPITSFPFFPRVMGGSALVRPLSLFPLILLVLLVTLPHLLRKPVPLTFKVLLPFVLIAVASSLISTLRGIETTSNVTSVGRILRALLTLSIGAAMYFTVSLIPRSDSDLRAALRWLYAGFVIALLWGSLQAVYVVDFDSSYFHSLQRLQDYISTRKLFTTRVSGMTYEPNWFAEQISSLLLPWLLSSVLSGYSAFRWRWRWLTLEWLLILWAVVVLALTFSRAGIAILLLLAFTGFLLFRDHGQHQQRQVRRGRKFWLLRGLEAVVVMAALGAFVFVAGMKNEFFSRIWNYWGQVKDGNLSEYFEYLGFGARFRYGDAAYRTYEAYPVLGVGLGNYAFYFPQMMPDTPLSTSPELLRLLLPEGNRERLITPKNFYLRLLAETGLVGLAAFVAFLVALFGCALFLWFSSDREQKFWGRAGLLGLLAFVVSAVSFDSFAIPNMWVVFGLTTSAAWIFSHPSIGDNVSRP